MTKIDNLKFEKGEFKSTPTIITNEITRQNEIVEVEKLIENEISTIFEEFSYLDIDGVQHLQKSNGLNIDDVNEILLYLNDNFEIREIEVKYIDENDVEVTKVERRQFRKGV